MFLLSPLPHHYFLFFQCLPVCWDRRQFRYIPITGAEQERERKAGKRFHLLSAIALGIIMSIVVLVGMDPILKLLGTDESTYAYTKQYVFWIALGATFSIFSGAFSNVIRIEGASKDAMIGHIVSSVTDFILYFHRASILGSINPFHSHECADEPFFSRLQQQCSCRDGRCS